MNDKQSDPSALTEGLHPLKRRGRHQRLLDHLVDIGLLVAAGANNALYMRCLLGSLRSRGVRICGKPLYISPHAYLDPSAYDKITLSDGVVVSAWAKLLVHDYSISKAMLKAGIVMKSEVKRVSPVSLGPHCFIGMGALIMPGVSIGAYSIIAAGAVVSRNVPDGSVVAGNPARTIKTTEDILSRLRTDPASYYTD